MPVHSVELGHLVLLNVNIEDSGMCDICIANEVASLTVKTSFQAERLCNHQH